jgi:hypothetical protein
MCNASATGHVVVTKTRDSYRVFCTTAERRYGPVVVTIAPYAYATTCPNCYGFLRVVGNLRVEDSNGRIVEAN